MFFCFLLFCRWDAVFWYFLSFAQGGGGDIFRQNTAKFLHFFSAVGVEVGFYGVAAVGEALQKIENAAGRVRTKKWGPRTLDIDILLYDDIEYSSTTLTIPHPLMYERDFVMIPLKEIKERH